MRGKKLKNIGWFLVIFGAAIPFDFRMYKRFSDVFCFIWEVLLKKNADVLKN